jgi:hypothetical protein
MTALPRAVRWWLCTPESFQSCEEGGGGADTLCQNSDVAIFVSQTSKKLQQQRGVSDGQASGAGNPGKTSRSSVRSYPSN